MKNLIIIGIFCGLFEQTGLAQEYSNLQIEKILYQDIYLANLLMNSQIPEQVKLGIKIATYDRMFFYWLGIKKFDGYFERSNLIENNYGAFYQKYFDEKENFLDDPLGIENLYNGDDLCVNKIPAQSEKGFPKDLLRSKKIYNELVKSFRNEISSWMPRNKKNKKPIIILNDDD